MPNIQNDAYERLCWEPGWLPFRINCGPIRGSDHAQAITWGPERKHAGVTDLAALVYGQTMIWLEVKQPGEKHLDSQIDFANAIESGGGYIYTIRSMEALERIIEMWRRSGPFR